MRMKGKKAAVLLLSALLAFGTSGVSAFANVPAEAETESEETEVTVSRIEKDINTDEETSEEDRGEPLTPDGNLDLVDDIITESGKQFITLTSRDGNYYYLIIDRSEKEGNNVYFLNMVDERDLLALMNEDDAEEIEQARKEEAERLATEAAEKESRKKAEEEAPAKAAAEKEKSRSARTLPTVEIGGMTFNMMQLAAIAGIFVLILASAGILIFRRKKKEEAVRTDPDSDYEDSYDDEYDLEEREDPEEEEEEFYGDEEGYDEEYDRDGE